ncbi:MAG: MFS transporter [Bacillota bacterium]
MSTKRWPVLVIGCVLLLFLGVIYAWSLFVAPLEAEFGYTRAQTSSVFAISISLFCIGAIVAGFIARKINFQNVLRLSALFLLLGFGLAALWGTLDGFKVGYGVLCGFGVGLGYNAVLASSIKWFPDKPGFCNGILLMGFGAGSMVLGAAITMLMGAFGWRLTFFVFGGVFALIMLVGSFLLKPPSQQLVAAKQPAVAAEEVPPLKMLAKPSFYLAYIAMLVLAAGGLAIIGQAAPMALGLGAVTALSTLLVGLISVCNGLGRIFFGGLFDRIGKKRAMLYVSVTMFAALGVLTLSLLFSQIALLVVGFLLVGLAFGGVPSTGSAFINRTYGGKNYAVNLSLFNSNLIPAALLGPMLAGSIFTATGSYLPILFVLLGCAALAGILIALIRDR